MSGHFGPHVSDAVAALVSSRAAHRARELNKTFALAQAHSVARSAFLHRPAKVAEVAARFPATFADHHYLQENPR